MNIEFLEINKMSVMIVDDSLENVALLRKTLLPHGYDISFASNGIDAVKLAINNRPHLMLLDVMMPEMNGFETCQLLKKNKETKNIAVIFITARTEISNVIKGFDLGGVDYITKPFSQEEVNIRVQTHLKLIATQINLKRAYRDIKVKNDLLSEMNEAKNTFIGMALGDLKDKKKFENIIGKLRVYHKKLKELG